MRATSTRASSSGADERIEIEVDGAVFDQGSFGEAGGDLYDQAVQVVLRDQKASTRSGRSASECVCIQPSKTKGAASTSGFRAALRDGRCATSSGTEGT